jgi:hypothetical protein
MIMSHNCLKPKRMTVPVFIFAVGSILAIDLLGCHGRSGGAANAVPVIGVVTLDGKPIEAALVVFCPETPTSPAASGKTDQEGRFTLTTNAATSGAAPGKYRITVTKEVVIGLTREQADAYVHRNHRPPPPPKITHLVPAQYAAVATSPLEVDVKPGMSDVSLALKK